MWNNRILLIVGQIINTFTFSIYLLIQTKKSYTLPAVNRFVSTGSKNRFGISADAASENKNWTFFPRKPIFLKCWRFMKFVLKSFLCSHKNTHQYRLVIGTVAPCWIPFKPFTVFQIFLFVCLPAHCILHPCQSLSSVPRLLYRTGSVCSIILAFFFYGGLNFQQRWRKLHKVRSSTVLKHLILHCRFPLSLVIFRAYSSSESRDSFTATWRLVTTMTTLVWVISRALIIPTLLHVWPEKHQRWSSIIV